ncbi:unnamed protein product [Paramecium pentaurelia]|uniref:Cytochrome b561 domain-containing protein n=1 Tax=Paramecium pentaurelia TaxID=43138 RepID=A0A8S1YGB7_9CILI|nr:unnamed protein product [Paramecium pentaurelia]
MLTNLLLFAFIIKKAYCQSEHNQYPQNSFLQESFRSQQDPYDVNYQEDQSKDKYVLFYFHQYTNFIGWAILVDLGIIANRYGILLKNKYDIHAIIMSIVVLPSIIAELFMIFSGNTPPLNGNQNLQGLHNIIGYTFLGLMIFQMLGGVIIKFCIQSVNTQTHLKIKSLMHIYLGYTIYLLGKIQLGFGYYMTYQNQKENGKGDIISFWCVYGFIFLWRIIFEMFYQNGMIYLILKKQNQLPKEHSGTLQDSLLIQYIEQNEQSHIYNEFQNKLWLIFNDEIIDLTGFSHPGGQYIWECVKGREVSRFIYGGCGLEDGTAKQYPHSKNAVVLLKNHVIGSLNTIKFTIPIDENTSTLWKLETITKLNDKTSYFGFTNPKYNIISQFTTIHSFGKYFQIQSSSSKKTPIRQYTCIASMAPENVAYRKELVKYIDYVYTTKQQAKVPQQPKYLKELPLIIKYYESKNGFSQYIHNHKDEMYDIQGPYGPPHGIPNSGKIVIICGGTGIFPFLDLLDFLLKTVIYQIALNKFGKQTADNLNPYDCQFNPNIHITLFFAAANKTELIGSDILFPIIQLQKYLDKPFLRLIIKIKDKIEGIETIEERFSKQMFDKFLGKTLDYQRYLICGPPPMQASVPIILQEMGIQNRFIHFI